MKPTDTPMSKISTTLTSANQKKNPKESGPMGLSISLIRKNEFALILGGALVVTLLVFFLFFRSSDSKIQDKDRAAAIGSLAELDTRIQAIEAALERIQKEGETSIDQKTALEAALNPLHQTVSRIENTHTVKFDSLTERMGKLEQQILKPDKKPETPVAKASPAAAPPKAVSTPEKKPAAKPSVQQDKKTFHTVEKGETLWGIAQKYQTSVDALRKLNKMSADAELHFGAKIQVK